MELVAFEGDPLGASDFEEPGVGNEDFELGGQESAGLDGGEEGPLDDDEEMKDEDLPPLDADEEGELDDADLLEPGFAPEEPAKRRGKAWKAAGAPIELGATSAVACVAKGVIAAAGAKIFRADLEGACEPLAGAGLEGNVVALATEGPLLAAVKEGGDLFVSRDGGATFAPVATRAAGVAIAGGTLWMVSPRGELRSSPDGGATWAAPLEGTTCAGLARHGAAVATVILDDAGTPKEVLLDVAAGQKLALPPGEPLAKGARVILAVRGGHVAVSRSDAGHAAQIWNGQSWSTIEAFSPASAMAFLDESGALLLATENDGGDGAWLVLVSAAGEASIVFDIDGELPRAIARDDAHGVAWVGGAHGLLAVEGGD